MAEYDDALLNSQCKRIDCRNIGTGMVLHLCEVMNELPNFLDAQTLCCKPWEWEIEKQLGFVNFVVNVFFMLTQNQYYQTFIRFFLGMTTLMDF